MIRKQKMDMRFLSLTAASALGLLAAAPANAQTEVPVGSFRMIELKGGGRVLVRHAAAQQVRIVQGNARISDIHLGDRGSPSGRKGDSGRLVIETCPNRCPIGYSLVVEIDTPNVEGVSVDGGGQIEIAADFPRQQGFAAAVKGSGRIDARAAAAVHASAAVSGDGEISLGWVDSLAAAVKGKGRIFYRGHPRLMSAVQGGGRIEQAD
jgi:putative autotransporter adhesin-like protein